MVASASNVAARFGPPPSPMTEGRWDIYRLTRQDALALVRQGLIPEDASTELLSGVIVLKDRSATGEDPRMIGRAHRICVERLSDLRSRINNALRHVESQQPLACSDIHQPEPDFMVIRGPRADAAAGDPTAADAFCVIEVADSSYERDAGPKLQGYARDGIEQYVIINLRNRTAEVYAEPDSITATYGSRTVIAADSQLLLKVGEQEVFAVQLVDLLP